MLGAILILQNCSLACFFHVYIQMDDVTLFPGLMHVGLRDSTRHLNEFMTIWRHLRNCDWRRRKWRSENFNFVQLHIDQISRHQLPVWPDTQDLHTKACKCLTWKMSMIFCDSLSEWELLTHACPHFNAHTIWLKQRQSTAWLKRLKSLIDLNNLHTALLYRLVQLLPVAPRQLIQGSISYCTQGSSEYIHKKG